MSCKKCYCEKCKPIKIKGETKKERELAKREEIKSLQKSAHLNYAIAALWKKIAQDFDKMANEVEAQIK